MDSRLYFLLGLAAFCTIFAGIVLVYLIRERAALTRRTEEIVNPELLSEKDDEHSFTGRASHVAALLRDRLGFSTDDALRARIRGAGFSNVHSTDLYIAIRVIAPAVAVLCSLPFSRNIFVLLVAAGLSYLLPDFALDRLNQRYRNRIRRALPDTVDLLVVCMDAGLGMDLALLRTAKELKLAYPHLSRELLLTNQEQNVGVTKQTAWKNLARRTQSEEIEQMVSMMLQAERFGTATTEALRVFADTLRTQRRLAVEERVDKSATYMLFPLILFILPVVFVVLLGPAILQIVHGLSNIAR